MAAQTFKVSRGAFTLKVHNTAGFQSTEAAGAIRKYSEAGQVCSRFSGKFSTCADEPMTNVDPTTAGMLIIHFERTDRSRGQHAFAVDTSSPLQAVVDTAHCPSTCAVAEECKDADQLRRNSVLCYSKAQSRCVGVLPKDSHFPYPEWMTVLNGPIQTHDALLTLSGICAALQLSWNPMAIVVDNERIDLCLYWLISFLREVLRTASAQSSRHIWKIVAGGVCVLYAVAGDEELFNCDINPWCKAHSPFQDILRGQAGDMLVRGLWYACKRGFRLRDADMCAADAQVYAFYEFGRWCVASCNGQFKSFVQPVSKKRAADTEPSIVDVCG